MFRNDAKDFRVFHAKLLVKNVNGCNILQRKDGNKIVDGFSNWLISSIYVAHIENVTRDEELTRATIP